MPQNIPVDDTLLNQALKVGGFKNQSDTINAALASFIEKHQRDEVIKLFGTMPCDKSYDYKAGRG
ncbi:MAG: type II toxin-antitoxin system VapB family antitoxin [Algicola sp.]|nr:type II toxin-antitoxin system VapB family antitoxin [Algicola sp.]